MTPRLLTREVDALERQARNVALMAIIHEGMESVAFTGHMELRDRQWSAVYPKQVVL